MKRLGGGGGPCFEAHFSIKKMSCKQISPEILAEGGGGGMEGKIATISYFMLNIIHLPKFRIAMYNYIQCFCLMFF